MARYVGHRYFSFASKGGRDRVEITLVRSAKQDMKLQQVLVLSTAVQQYGSVYSGECLCTTLSFLLVNVDGSAWHSEVYCRLIRSSMSRGVNVKQNAIQTPPNHSSFVPRGSMPGGSVASNYRHFRGCLFHPFKRNCNSFPAIGCRLSVLQVCRLQRYLGYLLDRSSQLGDSAADTITGSSRRDLSVLRSPCRG